MLFFQSSFGTQRVKIEADRHECFEITIFCWKIVTTFSNLFFLPSKFYENPSKIFRPKNPIPLKTFSVQIGSDLRTGFHL